MGAVFASSDHCAEAAGACHTEPMGPAGWPPRSAPHLEQPGVQQQRVGTLRVVLVADVQVLQLVQVPGSEGTMCGVWTVLPRGQSPPPPPAPCPSNCSTIPIPVPGARAAGRCRAPWGWAHLMYMAWRSISL